MEALSNFKPRKGREFQSTFRDLRSKKRRAIATSTDANFPSFQQVSPALAELAELKSKVPIPRLSDHLN